MKERGHEPYHKQFEQPSLTPEQHNRYKKFLEMLCLQKPADDVRPSLEDLLHPYDMSKLPEQSAKIIPFPTKPQTSDGPTAS